MILPPCVLPITPDLCASKGLQAFLRELEDVHSAGAMGVLLREPSLNDRDMLELASAAREIFHDGWLGVHDRVHVGAAVSADGIHLGYHSLRPEETERLVGSDVTLGVSHHLDEIEESTMRADYRFLSPVFQATSKPTDGATLGLSRLSSAAMLNRTWALGGMNAQVLNSVLSCGPAGVAAIGGVFAEGRSGKNMEAMLRAVGS